ARRGQAVHRRRRRRELGERAALDEVPRLRPPPAHRGAGLALSAVLGERRRDPRMQHGDLHLSAPIVSDASWRERSGWGTPALIKAASWTMHPHVRVILLPRSFD